MRRFFFDRLTQPNLTLPHDEDSRLVLLRESVREEIQRLVSGRSYFSGFHAADNGDKNILNWGIDHPVDFGGSVTEIKRLAKQILVAIRTFEPRIQHPKANIIGDTANIKHAKLQITGIIEVDGITDTFEHHFPISGDAP